MQRVSVDEESDSLWSNNKHMARPPSTEVTSAQRSFANLNSLIQKHPTDVMIQFSDWSTLKKQKTVESSQFKQKPNNPIDCRKKSLSRPTHRRLHGVAVVHPPALLVLHLYLLIYLQKYHLCDSR
jgi:hypothetical protein